MSDVSDLSKEELRAIARVVELWAEIHETLEPLEAWPREVLHIDTELKSGYLGWVGYNGGGVVTLHPAPADD